MLAEKYMLVLEMLRSLADRGQIYSDGSPKVVSSSQHIPIRLPGGSAK